MNDSHSLDLGPAPRPPRSVGDVLRDQFQQAWRSGSQPRMEDYLSQMPGEQSLLFAELLGVELAERRRAGQSVRLVDYLHRFPTFADLLLEQFRDLDTVNSDRSAGLGRSDLSTGREADPPVRPEVPPTALGRYRILARLGGGGFGVVYRGRDDELRRDVAVKVPHRDRVASPEDIEIFLTEARVLASLDHPHIVPVYDAGRTDDGLCYVVSKFIDGTDLKQRLRDARPAVAEAVELIATLAQALHYAHRHGLVHRDVKPANLLLDAAGKPYLADFGLVLRPEDFGKGTGYAGTPVYMSPEQARGDGHRVDGRSDVFSLGVVFYELLTGHRPFQGATTTEVLSLILDTDPRPPRQIDDAIPQELERICLKAMARRAVDRYTTAQDLAADLRAWQGRSAPTSPVPPTEVNHPGLGWLKAAVAGAVALSLFAGGVGIVVLSGALNGNPPQLTRPIPVRGAPRMVPTVKPLIWPLGREVCKWEVLPETNQLKVYTDSEGLLQVGETDADSWEFSATLRQISGVGRIGLFLGYRKDPRTSTAAYELVRILVVGNQVNLQRRTEAYRLDAPVVQPDGPTFASVVIKKPGLENTIRLVVHDNRLAEVWLNGQAVPELAHVPPPPPAAGGFGVFNRNSDGVFSNLLFKDSPIPLLAEASSPDTETP